MSRVIFFFRVRMHDNCMQKYKEGQRGELYFCIPIAVRQMLDQKKHEVIEDVVNPLRVGSRAQFFA